MYVYKLKNETLMKAFYEQYKGHVDKNVEIMNLLPFNLSLWKMCFIQFFLILCQKPLRLTSSFLIPCYPPPYWNEWTYNTTKKNQNKCCTTTFEGHASKYSPRTKCLFTSHYKTMCMWEYIWGVGGINETH